MGKPKKSPCGFCDENVKANEDGICCNACMKWYHKPCTKLDDTIFNALIKSKNEIHWFCALCKTDVKNILSNVDKFKKFNNELEKIRKEVFDRIDTAFEKINEIEKRLNDPKIPEASTENVKEVVANILKETDFTTNQEEIAMKEERKNNLIFFNIPESQSPSTNQRMIDDFNVLKQVYRGKVDLEESEIKKIYRIGKQTEGINRPLVIKFMSFDTKMEFLSNSKDVKFNDAARNVVLKISVCPDRTIKERQKHKELVHILKQRRANGEVNLIIRNEKIVFFREENSERMTWAQMLRKNNQPQINQF